MNGPFGEIKNASAAVGNAITAGVTAAAAFAAFPPGAAYAYLEGRNYSTAVVIQYALNPWLTIIKTTDALATNANATDYSDVAQNNMPVTGAVVLSSFATAHALWVGADAPFRGVFCDVSATNGNAATVAAEFFSMTGPTMTALSITDATTAGGTGAASFANDGGITWTVPTDWTKATLRAASGVTNSPVQGSGMEKFWIRFTVSAALDSSVTLNQMFAMNRSTSGYASLTSGRPGEWFDLSRGGIRHGCVEAKTDAVTANLIVIVATAAGGRFP